jgi:hypothetical protein
MIEYAIILIVALVFAIAFGVHVTTKDLEGYEDWK